jgi:ABC-type uncharacterized transport system ATPase subunit
LSESVVHVNALTKIFKVPEREAGLRADATSLFHRETRDVRAVDAVSFEIGPGEVVGFLGPNGECNKSERFRMFESVSGIAPHCACADSRRQSFRTLETPSERCPAPAS